MMRTLPDTLAASKVVDVGDVLCDVRNGIYDASAIMTFQQCPRKGYCRYIRGFVPKAFNPAANFGSLVHVGIHALLTGGDPREAIEAASRAWPQLPPDEFRTPGFAVQVVQAYARHYEHDPWVRLLDSLERRFAIHLPSGGIYTGRMDQVARHSETYLVVVKDYKTSSHMGDDAVPAILLQYRPNFQMDGYVFATHMLYGVCHGVLMDGIGIRKKKEPYILFRRVPEARRPEETARWVHEAEAWMRDIDEALKRSQSMAEPENAFRLAYNCYPFARTRCPYVPLCRYGFHPAVIVANYDTIDPVRRDEINETQPTPPRDSQSRPQAH